MRKFRFRFQTILTHRRQREEDALRALGAAQRAAHEARLHRQKLASELENALIRREQLAEQPTSVVSFQIEQSYIIGTKQRIIQADQGIVRANRGVEKALRGYLHARRQTKMFESLYEKEFLEYKKQAAKEAQKRLDDLTVMRHRFAAEDEVAQEEIA